MIKAIKLKECTPYQEAEIADCKKINFIFGANGSGKSTISSFLFHYPTITDERFSSTMLERDGQTSENIHVYNKEFRKVNFSENIPGIFTMGSATINEIKKIEELKEQRDKISGQIGTLKKTLGMKEIELNEEEANFKEEAWKRILKKNEKVFQKAFEGLRNNKGKFINELHRRIYGQPNSNEDACDREALLARAKTLYAKDLVKCPVFSVDIQQFLDSIRKIREDKIWHEVIVGNEDVDIGALIKELDNSSWVSQGRKYIRNDSNKCPFCQKDTITEEFRARLESFFNTEYESKIGQINEFRSEYKDNTNQIIEILSNSVSNETSREIGDLDADYYFAKFENLKNHFSACQRKIDEKLKQPGIKISIPDGSSIIDELFDLIKESNSRIVNHNNLVERADVERVKLTDDVWFSCISEEQQFISSHQSKKQNIEKAIKSIKEKIESQTQEQTKIEKEIVTKEKGITSVQPTIDEINRSLQAYGFTNFSIAPAKDSPNYYCIQRDDGTIVTDSLSEGEETFLTFLYFMQMIKGEQDPSKISDKKIIVLDDPVSSLDSTILYIVGAMVKELARDIRDGNGDVSQLFVLTHNVFFHKEASFINGKTSKLNDVNYWIIRKNNGISTVQAYNMENPISTSYELLWRELRENDEMSRVSIQNIMRRIIENYFKILGGFSDEDLTVKFKTVEEQIICKSLLYWINDGSHSIFDGLFIDDNIDTTSKYKKVFQEIFYQSGHGAHYDMMMKKEKT